MEAGTDVRPVINLTAERKARIVSIPYVAMEIAQTPYHWVVLLSISPWHPVAAGGSRPDIADLRESIRIYRGPWKPENVLRDLGPHFFVRMEGTQAPAVGQMLCVNLREPYESLFRWAEAGNDPTDLVDDDLHPVAYVATVSDGVPQLYAMAYRDVEAAAAMTMFGE